MWKRLLHQHQLHFASLVFAAFLNIFFLVSTYIFYETPGNSRDTWFITAMDRINSLSIDFRQKLRGPHRVSSNFALIAIDNESVDEIGRWPWSRETIANVIEELFQMGAKNIAVDIMLSEKSNQDILYWVRNLKTIPEESLSGTLDHFDADKKFSSVVKKYSDNLVMGITYEHRRSHFLPFQEYCYKYSFQKGVSFKTLENEGFDFFMSDSSFSTDRELPQEVEDFFLKNIVAKKDRRELLQYCRSWLMPGKDEYYDEFLERWPKTKSMSAFKNAFLWPALFPVDDWLLNFPSLAASTRFSGYLNTHPEIDGTVRTAQLLVRSGEMILPSLSLRTAMLSLGSHGGQVIAGKNAASPQDLVIESIELTNEDGETLKTIKTDSNSRFYISFAGRKFSYPHVSIRDLINIERSTVRVKQRQWDSKKKLWHLNRDGFEVDKSSFFKGKTVIIGATAIGLYDLRVTPFDENIPGAEVHLNTIDNIVSDQGYLRSFDEPPWMYLLLILMGFFISGIVIYFPIYISAALFVGATSGVVYYDYVHFFLNGTVTSIWILFFLSAATYFGVTFFDHFRSEKNRKELRKTFESYVSPSIVSEVLAHPENIKLGGKKVFMSVFFSDVRGFTSISEVLSPEDLSKVLNLYLTPMTRIIFDNSGTLDKYMGDAVMAFFGAPIKFDEHADSACRCALSSIVELKMVNSDLRAKGFPELAIGIGVNTGFMSVGNMGSETVRSYTVMGDAVNLGARLEGINKQYGTQIIISEFTNKELSSSFRTREIDWVRVKGKTEPVRIFELIGEGSLELPLEKMLPIFEQGLALYHQRQWQNAIDRFSSCLELVSEDTVSGLYIERCKGYQQEPPSVNWDGVYVMTSK